MKNQMEWPDFEEAAEEAKKAELAEKEAPKPGRVFVEIPKDCVTMRTNNLDQSFFTIVLPGNVIINGKDYAGWRFTQTKMFPSKYRDDTYVASFPRNEWRITLTKPFRKKDGEWDRETDYVTADVLKEALAAARKGAE